MPAVDLSQLPEGVVVLPEPAEEAKHLEPRAWVDAARRSEVRRLSRPVAEHLADARDAGDV